MEHPISVRLYFVKGDKDDTYKKKERFHLREVKEVDGINPKKALPDFHISIGDRRFSITTGSAEEKDEFIRELYKLSAQYLPVQMPDFCNVSIPVDQRELTTLPIENTDDVAPDLQQEYQPISAKEEADFRRLLSKAELGICEASKFSEGVETLFFNICGFTLLYLWLLVIFSDYFSTVIFFTVYYSHINKCIVGILYFIYRTLNIYGYYSSLVHGLFCNLF
uniref:Sec3-PIP2_bind domain-containing protein n=1 Tax=Heterorhabditis bacteriophora TaxID=37862 RepID=A0A1I7WXN3_HETBA